MEKCEKCGDSLFPWERGSLICGGCILAENYKKAHNEVYNK